MRIEPAALQNRSKGLDGADSSTQSKLGVAAVPPGRLRAGHFAIFLFLFALVLTIQIFVGPLRLSPYRLVLLLFLIPCVLLWVSGRAGKIRLPDVLFIGHAFWAAAVLILIHGTEDGIEPAGIYIVEVMGPYLLARCFIRSKYDYDLCIKFLFFIIAAMLPFIIYESFTGIHIINDALGAFFPVNQPHRMDDRWGLARAFGPFGHPILFGVFCSGPLGLISYALYRNKPKIMALVRPGVIVAATFFSLSAGPLVGLVTQIGLVIWDFTTRKIPRRWQIFGFLVLAAYVTVDIISNRTPVEVFISYLTFNQAASYNRILIWNYGTAEVLRHPIFGIGLNEWQRAWWMSASMDNFWLVFAVRYGIPGFLLYALGVFLLCLKLGRARFADLYLNDYRKGWLISIIGFVIAGTTVHYWNAVFCLFTFLLGSGVWMLDHVSTVRAASPQAMRAKKPVGAVKRGKPVGKPGMRRRGPPMTRR